MTTADVIFIIFLFVSGWGLYAWCFQTVPVAQEHYGGNGFYSRIEVERKRDKGRRWWLWIDMLIWFILLLFVWNRNDTTAPVNWFLILRYLSGAMMVIAPLSLSAFSEKEPLEGNSYDEESSVVDTDNARLLRQNRMQDVSRLQQASRRETQKMTARYIKNRVGKTRRSGLDDEY